jgi:ABC-type sugar transport system permease subunit
VAVEARRAGHPHGSLTGPAGPAPGAGRGRRRGLAGRPPLGYLLPVVVLLLALAGYPFVQLIRMAFSNVGPTNIIGAWSWVGLANISAELGSAAFWSAAKTTGEVTLVLLAADLVVGFFGASVLAEKGRVTSFVLGLMVFIWALPPLVSGSVWKFLLDGNGAVNSVLASVGIGPVNWLSSPHLAVWSVAGVAAWASVPFSILIIRGGMLGVSPSLIEAAAIDGAGYWRTQFRIVIPQIKPTLGVLAILVVLYAFRSFDFVYVLTSGGPGNVTTTLPYLAYQSAFTSYNWSIGAAVALLSMVVVAVLAVPYVWGVTREDS